MDYYIYNAKVYDSFSKSFCDGGVFTHEEKIVRVVRGNLMSDTGISGYKTINADGRLLIPGLVDIHTHGRAGGDFATADIGLMRKMARSYLSAGVTCVMPTLASATIEQLEHSIENINFLRKCEDNDIPYVAGIHLEGRYLNPAKRGAHAPELLSALDADELQGLLGKMDGAKHISAALELDDGGKFLKRALSCGATVALGHTVADYKTAKKLIEQGVTAFTHLFNAMPPLHHRDGGAVCAGLMGNVFCELICDGFHISPEMISLAYTLLEKDDRCVLITDSMKATGCADGEYTIAGMPVTVKNGLARTHDGAIAGSTLSLWDGVINLMNFANISFEKAIYCATEAPAKAVGISSVVGSLDVGKRADMLFIDSAGGDMRISAIMCGGNVFSSSRIK